MISSQTVTKQLICSLSWPGRLDGAWHPTWPGGGVCLNKPNTLHALVSRKCSLGPSSCSFLWLQSPQTCCPILWLELAPMAPTWFPDNYFSRPPPGKDPLLSLWPSLTIPLVSRIFVLASSRLSEEHVLWNCFRLVPDFFLPPTWVYLIKISLHLCQLPLSNILTCGWIRSLFSALIKIAKYA